MNEHTPTPWTVDPDHRPGMGWNAHVVEANDPNNRVCFMTSGPEGKINAAFIVKAVNNHDALVHALRNARNYIDGVIANSPDPKKRRNFGECLRIIEDALKPVGGNSFPHESAAE